jgi:quinol monooxygenase YgiN
VADDPNENAAHRRLGRGAVVSWRVQGRNQRSWRLAHATDFVLQRNVPACRRLAGVAESFACSTVPEMTMQNDTKVAFTVTWEVSDGNADIAADIIARFAPEARKEPGLEVLMVNRGATDPSRFLFYEVFSDAAAFEAHQETPHFRTLILRDALPLLSKRERVAYTPI